MSRLTNIRDVLCTELEKYSAMKNFNRNDLDMIHELADTIKDLDRVIETCENSYETLSEEDKAILQQAVSIMNR